MHGTIPQKRFISDFHSVYVLCFMLNGINRTLVIFFILQKV